MTQPLRTRPDYGECHGPPEEQPPWCPALPRGTYQKSNAMLYSIVLDDQGYASDVIDGFRSKQEAMEEAEIEGFDYVVKGTQMFNEPIGQIEESSRRADYWSVRRASLKEALVRLGSMNEALRPHIRPVLSALKEAGQFSVDERTITQDLNKIFDEVKRPRNIGNGTMWEIVLVPKYGDDGIVELYHYPDKGQLMVSSEGGTVHVITTSDDEGVWPTLSKDMKKAYDIAQRNPEAPLSYFESVLMSSVAKDLQIARDPARYSSQKQALISDKMHKLITNVDLVSQDLQNAVEAVSRALFRDRDMGDEEKAQAAQVLKNQIGGVISDIQKTKKSLDRL